MKNILLIALVLFTSISVFAQERTIEKSEFMKVYDYSQAKYKGVSYRVITTSQFGESKQNPGTLSKFTIEYVAPDISRYTSDSMITIKIGNKKYNRFKDEPWKDVSNETPPSVNKILEEQLTYKYIGNEILKGRKTTLYVVLLKQKSLTSMNKEMSLDQITKYWFEEDGILIKREMQIEGLINQNPFYTFMTSVYELDPNIKIEAPNLNSNK